MRSTFITLIALGAFHSVPARSECQPAAARPDLNLSQSAIELRNASFAKLCTPGAAPIVDADDAALRGRLIGPAPSNQAEFTRYDFYPKEARERHVEGTTVLVFVVEVDGKVSQYARIQSSGSELLDNAAVTALSAIRYKPGLLDGVPVRVFATMPFKFKLP